MVKQQAYTELIDVETMLLDVIRDEITELELYKRHIYHLADKQQKYMRGELQGVWGAEDYKKANRLELKLRDRVHVEFSYLSTLLDEFDNLSSVSNKILVTYLLNPDLSLTEIADELGITHQNVRNTLLKYERRLTSDKVVKSIRGSRLAELRKSLYKEGFATK